jgi:AcrR family transcriptional regulator
MSYSQSRKVIALSLTPIKTPSQSRSMLTVEAILEGAAQILERQGLEGYTTNEIAERAGVSIGSLYQYFPSKDAVTIALIDRESATLVDEVKAALLIPDFRQALCAMIETAVRHQLQRPKLAQLLDFEESRLSPFMPISSSTVAVHCAIVVFLKRNPDLNVERPDLAATDMMAITCALTDTAGRREEVNSLELEYCIEGALLGYLGYSRETRSDI